MVKKIKAEFPNLRILFDGGINDENLLDIKNAGVDVFCIGHLLTDGDFVDNLRFIKKIINS
jgi:pentose-5-phosphate-3-epimerase